MRTITQTLLTLASVIAALTLTTAAFADEPGLTPDDLRATMNEHRTAVRGCVFEATAGVPQQIDMVVEMIVTGDGVVTDAAMFESNSQDADLDECVVDVVRDVQFDAPGNGRDITVRYAFLFVTGS